jgi:hypothetical protein
MSDMAEVRLSAIRVRPARRFAVRRAAGPRAGLARIALDAEPEPSPARAPRPAPAKGGLYLTVLTWAFTLFNSLRVASYLPTLWVIHASGNSDQHSLVTWLTWFGANATMAAWLYEQNERRVNRAVTVNIGNAAMCLATLLLIVAHRW